jgi:hypothetical protein
MNIDINTKNKEIIYLLVYPYYTTLFLVNKLNLTEFPDYVKIEFWEISKTTSNIQFNKSLDLINYNNKFNFRKFDTIISFAQSFRRFVLQHEQNLICINNMVPQDKTSYFIIRAFLKFQARKVNIKYIETLGPGIPISNLNEFIGSNKSGKQISKIKNVMTMIKNYTTIKNIWRYFLKKIDDLCPFSETYFIVAGRDYEKILDKVVKKSDHIVKAHSRDYNEYILKKKIIMENKEHSKKWITLLDGAGPGSYSDTEILKIKTHITAEVWYPRLSDFLSILENKYNVSTKVAGHYLTNYKNPCSLFSGREVIYDKTLELVSNSEFVITRRSASISFAVILKKPIILIYSNQLKKDAVFMRDLNILASKLGTVPINIDHPPDNFDIYLKVNEIMYSKYEENFLTSADKSESNIEIITRSIFHY